MLPHVTKGAELCLPREIGLSHNEVYFTGACPVEPGIHCLPCLSKHSGDPDHGAPLNS